MGIFPTALDLTIKMADGTVLSLENCGIWVFGYDGDIVFEDGAVRARTIEDLDGNASMTVMVSLPKGLISPERTVSGSFESVKERAFEGRDYEFDEEGLTILGVIMTLLSVLSGILLTGALGLFGVHYEKRKKEKRIKKAPYFREEPCEGNLNMAHRLGLACGFCEDDSLIGAYLLRLIAKGSLEPEAGADKDLVDLRLVGPPAGEDIYEESLYDIFEAAAGEDGVLSAGELEFFADENSMLLLGFLDSCREDGLRCLIRDRCVRDAHPVGEGDLTERGIRRLDELLGLERYLLDFSLIRERRVIDAAVWENYLVYAYLLGIADKVLSELRKLYPGNIGEIERLERSVRGARYYDSCAYAVYAAHRKTYSLSVRSSGGGGHLSFSGGGGGGTC